MNKCLVTTLKAHTNNEALSKYNVLTIKTKAIETPTINTQWINIGASEKGSVSVNSTSVGLYQGEGISGELKPYPVTVLSTTTLQSHFENKDGIIEISGKYNIKHLHFGRSTIVRIKEIYGMLPGTITGITIQNVEEGEIDANKFVNIMNISEIVDILIPSSNVAIVNKLSKDSIGEFKALTIINENMGLFDSIGLDDLSNNININTIHFVRLNAGNLSSFAKLTKLTQINFSNYKQNNGDIMDFINPWIQAGRTSGKIQVNWLLGQNNITLNGSSITYPSGVDNSKAYLNWTSDGTVTFTAS